MKRFVIAALGASFLASPVLAAEAPQCHQEAQDGQLCQQQLTNLHTIFDRLERSNAETQGALSSAQQESTQWKTYYDACATDTGWICGPWPKPSPSATPATPPVSPASPAK